MSREKGYKHKRKSKIKISKTRKEKMKKGLIKPTKYWLGKKNIEHSKRMKGKHVSPKTEFRKGQIGANKGKKIPALSKPGKLNPFYGKHHTKKWKKLMGKKLKGRKFTDKHKQKISLKLKGENNGSWQGGISFEPYSIDWTKTLRNSIRERDRYTCQVCRAIPSTQVHHINYNKKDCNINNLITLCLKCHRKTNFNRKDWIKYFKEVFK